MKILYKNKSVLKDTSAQYYKKWKYPQKVKEALLAAVNFIENADTLLAVAKYPPFHFHSLEGDRNKEWGIDIGGRKTGYRLVVQPCDDEGSAIKGGDIMARCSGIKIIMFLEMTNHYD